jgi:glycine cleavage system pyridoxal-binding protein P
VPKLSKRPVGLATTGERIRMSGKPKKVKQYVFRIVAGDAVEHFLNEEAEQGFELENMQPAGKTISVTETTTMETVSSLLITMVREVEKI